MLKKKNSGNKKNKKNNAAQFSMPISKYILLFLELDFFNIIDFHGCLQCICVQVLEEMF